MELLESQHEILHRMMSSDHQDGDLALKSLSITVKEDSIILTWFNNLSKLTKNSSNSLLN